MRNGRHESNAPSRFLRELAPQYLDHPLRREEFTASQPARPAGEGFTWRSSRPSAHPSQRSTSFQRPSSQSQAQPSRTVPLDKPPLIDPDFVPEPMSAFSVGDQIEHNRFGAGKVLEITGQIPDLKAKIRFEKYGEKLLLLKFAKIRHK
jgi:DNA helicase-2/ATP-dependent DNA helicase PcrA